MLFKCDSCGEEFSRVRFKSSLDGIIRCRCCSKAKYKETEKGKATDKRYFQGEAFKATQKRFLQSKKGKSKQKRYEQSDKGKVAVHRKNMKRYWSDPEYWREYALVKLHGEYELDNKCYLCGTQGQLTLDHLHPRSKGGENKLENYGTLCMSCNAFKGNRLMTPGGAILLGDY